MTPDASGVAVAHLLFAECGIDSAGHSVAEPDHGSKQKDGKRQKKCINHANRLRDFPLYVKH